MTTKIIWRRKKKKRRFNSNLLAILKSVQRDCPFATVFFIFFLYRLVQSPEFPESSVWNQNFVLYSAFFPATD